jgi:N-alpha-acetyltransferase 35, NatC auxiliary subunit
LFFFLVNADSASASLFLCGRAAAHKTHKKMAAPPPAYIDVAPLLAAAAGALDTNDLLHGPLFSLHDVMTAVEVGDAKLDAGAAGKLPKSAAAADGACAPGCPPRPAADTALAVADGLLAAEAAWHAGGSAGTTILPCTYMLRPDR